jgi:uncharacterized membrane protein
MRADMQSAVSLGGTTFFAVYLFATGFMVRGLTADDLRQRARAEDEGITVIVIITLAAVALSLGSLAFILGDSGVSLWHRIPAIVNVPLGWATLHMVMTFHYAKMFYAPREDANGDGDTGGLDFPGTEEPSIGDFIYYAFVVGMTAQVSDVQTTSRGMRNFTLVHSVVSFFFNAVIVAFAVNVAATR